MEEIQPKILLTGGTGSVGRVVVSSLLEKGWVVTVLGRHEPVLVHPSLKWCPLDLKEFSAPRGLTAGYDVVLHMAHLSKGEGHLDRNIAAHLAEDAVENQVPCFFYTSSIRVYGNAAGLIKEDITPQPCVTDAYAKQKLEIEGTLFNRLGATKTRLHILRVGHVVSGQGLGEVPNFLSMKYLMMWGKTHPHYIHVSDVSAAITFLVGARKNLKHQLYNLTRELDSEATFNQYFSSKLGGWKSQVCRLVSAPPLIPRLLYRRRSEARCTRAGRIAEANLLSEGWKFSGDDLSRLLGQDKEMGSSP